MNTIKQHFNEASGVLNNFMTKSNYLKIQTAGEIMVKSILQGGKILSCGNGGSMCDAMHFAEELTGRFREDRKSLPAISISDPSHIACVGNDYGFEYIFSRFIEGVGNKNDVLLGISTSGNSENVLNAIKAANKKGMHVVALTGKDGGKIAHENVTEIRVEHFGYADRIQEIHIKIIHCLINYIEQHLEVNKSCW